MELFCVEYTAWGETLLSPKSEESATSCDTSTFTWFPSDTMVDSCWVRFIILFAEGFFWKLRAAVEYLAVLFVDMAD